MGVDAFVLKYRLIYSGPGAPKAERRTSSERPKRFVLTGAFKAQAGQDMIAIAAADGRQAVRVLRERAAEFGIRPDRIGMIGYSAGGVVTSETLFGPLETRPNFAAIIYGVGEIKEMPQPAPPLFLAVAADDALAVGRSIDLFTFYRKEKGQVELHVFQIGARVRQQRRWRGPLFGSPGRMAQVEQITDQTREVRRPHSSAEMCHERFDQTRDAGLAVRAVGWAGAIWCEAA